MDSIAWLHLESRLKLFHSKKTRLSSDPTISKVLKIPAKAPHVLFGEVYYFAFSGHAALMISVEACHKAAAAA